MKKRIRLKLPEIDLSNWKVTILEGEGKGGTMSGDYHLFPIPNSEVLASGGVITQTRGIKNS